MRINLLTILAVLVSTSAALAAGPLNCTVNKAPKGSNSIPSENVYSGSMVVDDLVILKTNGEVMKKTTQTLSQSDLQTMNGALIAAYGKNPLDASDIVLVISTLQVVMDAGGNYKVSGGKTDAMTSAKQAPLALFSPSNDISIVCN